MRCATILACCLAQSAARATWLSPDWILLPTYRTALIVFSPIHFAVLEIARPTALMPDHA